MLTDFINRGIAAQKAVDKIINDHNKKGAMQMTSADPPPKVIDLGFANGWSETPAIVKNCQEKKHHTLECKVRKFVHQVRCDICGYKYKYDSS